MYYPPKLFWSQVSAWGFVDTGEADRRANINSRRIEIWVRRSFDGLGWTVQASNVDTDDTMYLATERRLSAPRVFRSLDAVQSVLDAAGRHRFYVDGSTFVVV